MTHSKKELAEFANKMKTRVERLFKELMPDVTLVKVLTEPSQYWEGEDSIDVRVIFDSTERLDPGKTLELRTRAGMHPDDEDDDPQPVFYFTSMPDARELGLVS